MTYPDELDNYDVEVTNANFRELEARIAATAKSSHWNVEVNTEDWQAVAENNTFAGITAAYKASKSCEGMTEATDISGIQFTGGDRTAAGKWDFLRPTEGNVELYATAKPAATFSLRLTEVK